MDNKMNTAITEHLWVVIMAGGTGSRFWPVSRNDNPKQFVDVMGVGKSMLESTFSRMEKVCPKDHIIIVTEERYVERVRSLIPELKAYQVLGEPIRRGTAPCIAYASSVIASLDASATLVVTPSDHAIFREQNYVSDIHKAVALAQEKDWIITFGAEPTRPDTSYGYIQLQEEPALAEEKNLHKVVTFTEKPPIEMARQFIQSGEFYWNTGLLVWSLRVLQRSFHRYLPAIAEPFFTLNYDSDGEYVKAIYSQCESISVDFGIMEKVDDVYMLKASFGWSDVETWDSLYDVTPHNADGNAMIGGNIFAYNCKNCMMDVSDSLTLAVEGLEDYIVAADGNTVMICRRSNDDMIYKFISDIELRNLRQKK